MSKTDTPQLDKLDDVIDAAILQTRRLFISDGIDDQVAYDIIRKLWYLDLQDSKKPIKLIINSPGGSVDSGFAIWDQAQMIKAPVVTLVTGLAASMGSVLSLCAPKDKRFATPNSRFMIHQPLIQGVIRGQATDLDIQAQEMIKTRSRIVELYCDATGKSADVIEKAIDRDTWMSALEAKEFGLLHKIVTNFDELEQSAV